MLNTSALTKVFSARLFSGLKRNPGGIQPVGRQSTQKGDKETIDSLPYGKALKGDAFGRKSSVCVVAVGKGREFRVWKKAEANSFHNLRQLNDRKKK